MQVIASLELEVENFFKENRGQVAIYDANVSTLHDTGRRVAGTTADITRDRRTLRERCEKLFELNSNRSESTSCSSVRCHSLATVYTTDSTLDQRTSAIDKTSSRAIFAPSKSPAPTSVSCWTFCASLD